MKKIFPSILFVVLVVAILLFSNLVLAQNQQVIIEFPDNNNQSSQNSNEPRLETGSVTPSYGPPGEYTFHTYFSDPQNRTPEYVKIYIADVNRDAAIEKTQPHLMQRTSNITSQGTRYDYTTDILEEGQYQFYFEAKVGDEILHNPYYGGQDCQPGLCPECCGAWGGPKVLSENLTDKHKIYLFNKDKEKPLWSYDVGKKWITSVCISADNKFLAAADNKGGLYLFNINSNDYSGAIMVGAGKPSIIDTLEFTNFGSRIDVHAWGDSIVSTGYGDLWFDIANSSDVTRWYTAFFSGTSGASPMIAGCIVAIQSIRKHENRPLLNAQDMLKLLKKGASRQIDPSNNIGPRPNMRAILKSSINGVFFDDENANGKKDSGEPVRAKRLIYLSGTSLKGNTINKVCITDPFGNYKFEDVVHGNYKIAPLLFPNEVQALLPPVFSSLHSFSQNIPVSLCWTNSRILLPLYSAE